MPIPNDGVEVSLNPDELDMADQRGLERKYEEQLRKQNRIRMDNEEDFSDMVAEHSAKQNVRFYKELGMTSIFGTFFKLKIFASLNYYLIFIFYRESAKFLKQKNHREIRAVSPLKRNTKILSFEIYFEVVFLFDVFFVIIY